MTRKRGGGDAKTDETRDQDDEESVMQDEKAPQEWPREGKTMGRHKKSVYMPSKEEQERHRRDGHFPYASWCSCCIRGRKPNAPHKASERKRDELSIPEVHADYCFLRNASGEESAPTLVLKDYDSRALAAHVVPYKGGDSEWVVQQVAQDLVKWGIYDKVMLRTD